jgi:hypothetical protein
VVVVVVVVVAGVWVWRAAVVRFGPMSLCLRVGLVRVVRTVRGAAVRLIGMMKVVGVVFGEGLFVGVGGLIDGYLIEDLSR